MAGVFATPRPLPSPTIPLLAGAAVVVLALPIFLAAGWSLRAWLIGGVLWAASRAARAPTDAPRPDRTVTSPPEE